MTAGQRFPDEVAAALHRAGWTSGRAVEGLARDMVTTLAAYTTPDGLSHAVVEPVLPILVEFGGLAVTQEGAGEQIARSSFTLDPLRALHTVRTLAEFAPVIDADLTPIGDEADGVAFYAVDEHGRVFAFDHGGEWFLGTSIDAALRTLILGRQPPRVREDGTWDDAGH